MLVCSQGCCYCYIMRQPSRATLYRQRNRRLKGQRASRLGRKRISSVKVGRDNAFIELALMFIRRGRMRMMPTASRQLESSGFPAPLLAIAAWDVCKPTQRKRAADKLRVESMAKKFVAHFEGRLSIAEARRLVAKAIDNNEAWLAEFATGDRPSGDYAPSDVRKSGLSQQFWKPTNFADTTARRDRGACPSTELNLSRRMISYWRHHRSYGAACALVRRVWRDAEGD